MQQIIIVTKERLWGKQYLNPLEGTKPETCRVSDRKEVGSVGGVDDVSQSGGRCEARWSACPVMNRIAFTMLLNSKYSEGSCRSKAR